MSRPEYLILSLWVCTTLSAFAQAPLPPEVEAHFQAGAHSVIGCEGCHWEGPDRIPRNNIPTVCGDCHPRPQDDYATSVHWDGGVAHAVCTDCHGVHGILPVANPKSRAHRSLVCGSCHPGPKEELARGPHHAAFENSGALVCASCHGNHSVQPPTISAIEPACEACHERDTEAFAFGSRVSEQLESLRTRAAHAKAETESAAGQGYETDLANRTRTAAEGQFRQVRLIWHSLDGDRIDEQISRTAGLFDRTLVLIQERIDTQTTREKGVVIVWIVIAIAVCALHAKRKSIESTSSD